MKKLQQSVGAGRQIALQKMERRNCQKNTIIGPGAHAAPESQKEAKMQEPASIILSVKEPKKVKGTTKKTGMISLRVERITARLLRSMKECPGASFETHADACKIGLSTFYRWMDDGEKDPSSVYGKFREAMLQAMAEGEKTLHNMAARSTPIHVLTRRFPQHYPSERQLMELSAPGGQPLIPASENSFSVVLDIYPQEQAGDEKPISEVFRVVQPNGSVDLWQPPKANGEKPPHS
jgi:hypothetical protein